ncbi:hypothetical protein V6C59_03395 [Acinetobacter bereziniae]|uniref:hypothetical protein n=1 Tax=Acinetobacter bereziniae TaxID=106648 RepID=UPI002FDA5D81
MFNEILKIYGFGSFFNSSKFWTDIDFCIIHSDTSKESCENAINLKTIILENIHNADVTLLSVKEECELNFIVKSKAKLLGYIQSSNLQNELFYIFDLYGIIKI